MNQDLSSSRSRGKPVQIPWWVAMVTVVTLFGVAFFTGRWTKEVGEVRSTTLNFEVLVSSDALLSFLDNSSDESLLMIDKSEIQRMQNLLAAQPVSQTVRFMLVQSGCVGTKTDVVHQLSEKGSRPANLAELVAFALANPTEPGERSKPIISIDVGDDNCFAVLKGCEGKPFRQVMMGDCASVIDWDSYTVLAVYTGVRPPSEGPPPEEPNLPSIGNPLPAENGTAPATGSAIASPQK